MNICKVEGCNTPVKYKSMGLCNKHGIQMSRYGKIIKHTRKDPNEIIHNADGTASIVLRNKHGEKIASALIDVSDIPLVKRYKWSLFGKYAGTNNPKKKLHQILNPDWKYTDHINGNSLDNRRCNLRQATHAQNMRNAPIDCRNHTGYKGVRIRKGRNGKLQATKKKYQVRITVNKKEIYLGYFEDIVEAAKVYDEAAKKYFGEFARLNFPEYGGTSCRI